MTDTTAPTPTPGANTAQPTGGDTTTTTQQPAGDTTTAQPTGDTTQQPAGGAQPWWDGKITEPDIVDFMKAKNYQTPEDAARAAWSANKMLKMEPIIQAFVEGTATPEQEAAMYNRLGRPESADKYELKPAEGVQVNSDLETMARGLFHDAGLSQKQADKIYQAWNAGIVKLNEAVLEREAAENEKAMAELEKTWGPDIAKNKAAGERVMNSLGLDEATMDKIQSSIGAAPLVDLLVRIGSKSAEPNFQGGSPQGSDPNDASRMTPEQAKARITELTADAKFQAELADTSNPEVRKQRLATWEALFAKAG